ncbi:MAG: PBP1A family penicillin-binding protein [Epsilonproteobacteria bacterium]|nr:PBP1A family penicillin-binding protein [Campylobacterota bacterium]
MLKKIFLAFLLLIIVAAGVVGWYGYKLYNSVEFDPKKLTDYNPPLSTRFYDRNGTLLDIRYSKENRFYVKYNEIPPKVIETLLATEDTSFFEHGGVNFNAIIRALIKDIKAGKKVEGASTITQQLVRNMYLTRKKTIERKVKEMIISMRVEQLISKQKILEIYLNQIFFGHNYYGIRTAALGYFHKDLKDLSLKQIAMLIALPKGPSLYDPTRHYELNLKRANWILTRMYNIGWISEEDYKKALLEKPKVYKTMVTPKAQYAVDEAIKRLKKEYPDLLYGGYNVYLSIDMPTQKLAEEAIKWNYKRLLEKNKDLNASTLNGALITINQKTGDVLAMVGGVDYNTSKFNRVTQSKRSVGSAIKPFIYQIALNSGFNPASLIPDISRTFKVPGDTPQEQKYWKPKNYERNTKGLITLREALVHSRNLATINLVLSLGLDKLVEGLEKFGFKDFPHDLSISLGSLGESLWDMSKFYTIISNYGVKTYPRLILKVENRRTPSIKIYKEKHEEIEPDYQAYLVINLMQDVVKRGTGVRARVKGIEIAGKTGTTNNYKDAWFCGFTPDTETIIWFGNDNSTSLGRGMAGGSVSAPVFRRYYTELLKLHPEMKRKFKVPKGVHYFYHNGKKELYTKISLPPKEESIEEETPIF